MKICSSYRVDSCRYSADATFSFDGEERKVFKGDVCVHSHPHECDEECGCGNCTDYFLEKFKEALERR